MVSITSTVTIAIKILIVILTGLITLSWTGVTQDSYPMVIQDTFVDSTSRLSHPGALPLLVLQAIAGSLPYGQTIPNVTYPDGISEDYAFQSVQVNLSDTVQTQVTVDGLINSLDCQPADVIMTSYNDGTTGAIQYPNMNLTITSPGCNLQTQGIEAPAWILYGNTSTALFARFAETQCNVMRREEGAGDVWKPDLFHRSLLK